MPTIQEKLETLFDKVRSLPQERQEAAVEALADITSEPYVLSEDELAVLKPALERAKRGEFSRTRHKRCRRVSSLPSPPGHPTLSLSLLRSSLRSRHSRASVSASSRTRRSPLAARRFGSGIIVAVLGISSALHIGNTITETYQSAEETIAGAKADEARLRALFVHRDGHVEPFRQRDLHLAQELQKPRTIPDIAPVAAGAPMWFCIDLVPAALFLLIYARFIYAGYHYFFSRHPIEAAAGLYSVEHPLFAAIHKGANQAARCCFRNCPTNS